jgi:hypothetical protein
VHVVSVRITDSHFYLQATSDRVTAEVRQGDIVQAGVVVANSGVGASSLRISPMVYFSLTWATAFKTPLPPYRTPPSRSSTASYLQVEAPEGTDAEAVIPESSAAWTRRVGFPRESRISWAKSETIVFIAVSILPSFERR